MNKLPAGWPAAGLMLLVAGCASGPIERHELEAAGRDQAVKIPELVDEMHRAMAVLRDILARNPALADAGLALDQAVLTLDSKHSDTEDGKIDLLIASTDTDASSEADSTISLTFLPPADDWQPSAGDDEHAAAMRALIETYREKPACNEREANTPDAAGPVPDHQPWEALVQVTTAALEARYCLARTQPEGAPMLDALSVTIAVDLTTTESEGAGLKLGRISLGETATQKTDDKIKIALTFKRASD